MKAVILAAGFGRRMRPLTDSQHKTLLPVAGRPIIDRMMEVLREHAIRDVVVATGYLADTLENHLTRHHGDMRFHFVRNPRYAETNNVHSLALVLESGLIDEDCLLIESDLVFDAGVLRALVNGPWDNAALVDRYRPGMEGTVVTVEDGMITSIIPPHLQGEQFDFFDKYKTLNIYRFSAEFCNRELRRLLNFYTRVYDRNAYYELILGILIYIQRAAIHAVDVAGERWAELDDPHDLEQADFVFAPGSRYQALQQAFGGYWNYALVDYSLPCNRRFPPASLLSQLKANAHRLLDGYGSNQDILDRKLATFLLCDRNNVVLLNGLSQVYPWLGRHFAGARPLIPAPGFGEYSRVLQNHSSYLDKPGFSLDEVEQGAAGCNVVVFVNPNNPTGSFVTPHRIVNFAARHPDKTILVDESFAAFSAGPSVQSLLQETPRHNVIVLCSLGKALGAPGLRLGYVYAGNPELLEALRRELPVWNCNSFAEHFLELLLKFRDEYAASLRDTIADRAKLAQALASLEMVATVFPSQANFLLIRLAGPAAVWQRLPRYMLGKHRILLKDVSDRFNDGGVYLRIAVRRPEDNQRLVMALADCQHVLA